MNLIAWAIPGAAFLIAIVMLARQARREVSHCLVGATAGSERFRRGAAVDAPPMEAGPECQPRWDVVQVSERSVSSTSEERNQDEAARDEFARLCRQFRIREVSVVPASRQTPGQAEPNLEVLVDFEPQARVDYPVFFRLRNELFMLLGRQVNLVCKNSVERHGRREDLEHAQVLYAA